MIIRESKFFDEYEDAQDYATQLRERGHKDVVVVLKKNREDLCRMASALARTEGAWVNWTWKRDDT
ncbi:hypothetical protein HFN51_04450 [Rhizobium leguminosarum]|nr:hypothetical protein [Rhizobium leguminosarum]